MRIAVASSDGIVINQHFGRANQFFIYQKDETGITFIEKRVGIPFCHSMEHNEKDLKNAIDQLWDCSAVFVLQIGNGAENELRTRKIIPYVTRGLIEEVLMSEL